MKGDPVRIARNSRKSMALVVGAGLLLSLAACTAPSDSSADPASDGDCTPVAAGAASKAVKVTGDFAALPVVIFDPGLDAKTTERSVVIEGDGDLVVNGDKVLVQFSILNGGTAVNIDGTSYKEGEEAQFPIDDTLLPGLVKTMECSTVGSRVVGVIPPADAFGATGSTDLGIGADDDIVFVADIISIVPPLTPAEWTKDVPDVTFADDGTPTVTLPAIDPPTELMSTVLTEGDGAVVASTDTVTLDYQGTSWDTGEIFDQSYGKTPITLGASSFVPGFSAALIGQKVGSTILVVIPPEYAYGTDPAAHELGGQTLVFVLKIEAIA
ncbi:FKBP-type peptidyl-prolyl cis-trans isomerase [soil metagenome]